MNQSELPLKVGEAYARRYDPATAQAAAEHMEGAEATVWETMVVATLKSYAMHNGGEGLTTHELCDRYKLPYETVTPRMRPLVKKGLIVDSGERRIPAGRTRKSIVWKPI